MLGPIVATAAVAPSLHFACCCCAVLLLLLSCCCLRRHHHSQVRYLPPCSYRLLHMFPKKGWRADLPWVALLPHHPCAGNAASASHGQLLTPLTQVTPAPCSAHKEGRGEGGGRGYHSHDCLDVVFVHPSAAAAAAPPLRVARAAGCTICHHAARNQVRPPQQRQSWLIILPWFSCRPLLLLPRPCAWHLLLLPCCCLRHHHLPPLQPLPCPLLAPTEASC